MVKKDLYGTLQLFAGLAAAGFSLVNSEEAAHAQQPPPSDPAGYGRSAAMISRGGGAIREDKVRISGHNSKYNFYYIYRFARASSILGRPNYTLEPGQCGWIGRAIDPAEPNRLCAAQKFARGANGLPATVWEDPDYSKLSRFRNSPHRFSLFSAYLDNRSDKGPGWIRPCLRITRFDEIDDRRPISGQSPS